MYPEFAIKPCPWQPPVRGLWIEPNANAPEWLCLPTATQESHTRQKVPYGGCKRVAYLLSRRA